MWTEIKWDLFPSVISSGFCFLLTTHLPAIKFASPAFSLIWQKVCILLLFRRSFLHVRCCWYRGAQANMSPLLLAVSEKPRYSSFLSVMSWNFRVFDSLRLNAIPDWLNDFCFAKIVEQGSLAFNGHSNTFPPFGAFGAPMITWFRFMCSAWPKREPVKL